MQKDMLQIGIILGSTRPGRVSPQVGSWLKELADQRGDAQYYIIDLADYQLPFYGHPGGEDDIKAWASIIGQMDGFVFVTAEYNHSITGVLKNAIDHLRDEWGNKAAGIISYGSTGGARAAEHLRGILGEINVADVRIHPTLSMFTDFENFKIFKPADLHQKNTKGMLDQVITWSTALRTTRVEKGN